MSPKRWVLAAAATTVAVVVGVVIWQLWPPPDPCQYLDEAKCAGLTAADFPQSFDDYFRDMDGGIELTPGETAGRNTWMIWTAGDEAFWNFQAKHAFGAFDLLKTISSYPGSKYSRDNRFSYMGLINEPGFERATVPDQFGLWLDQRVITPEPFDEQVYGKASGVVGLRLYPNPAFDEKAQGKWDAQRYYGDPSYYQDSDLVRPYRVGVSCAFCHVSPNPVNPPEDPENPQWSHLSTNVGAQYFWASRIFTNTLGEDNYFYQLLSAAKPGTVDTSAFATDNIFNPRTMNAVYDVKSRLAVAQIETLAGTNLDVPGTTKRMEVPHVLKDGSDSVGVLGALGRVYINIGEFHQEWLRHFNPLIGGKRQTPIEIKTARKNSVFWEATAERMPNLRDFFLKVGEPHHLADAPGGEAYLTQDEETLTRGKIAFADNCAECHSSKLPAAGIAPGSPEFIQQMREEVLKPDFLQNNYLSNDRRYSVVELGTNICSPLGTNGMRGHVWDNYTSETFKNLPSVGKAEVYNPFDQKTYTYDMPSGGRGYTRSPSLISLWSTAPFLLNNSVGKFTGDPSVSGRMESFDDSIEKMLWPEKRLGVDSIQRTTVDTFIVVSKGFLPKILQPLLGGRDEIRIGPIPAGTPINLFGSLDLEIEKEDIPQLLRVLRDMIKIKKGEDFTTQLAQDILALSKCPDFITDRGHEYGSGLSDEEKRALIEYMKNF